MINKSIIRKPDKILLKKNNNNRSFSYKYNHAILYNNFIISLCSSPFSVELCYIIFLYGLKNVCMYIYSIYIICFPEFVCLLFLIRTGTKHRIQDQTELPDDRGGDPHRNAAPRHLSSRFHPSW